MFGKNMTDTTACHHSYIELGITVIHLLFISIGTSWAEIFQNVLIDFASRQVLSHNVVHLQKAI